jgi:Helix-turn-helix of DDE superfamily endonuclease
MRWQTVKNLSAEQFKRLVGVKPATFEKMVSEAKRISKAEAHKIMGKKRGPKEKLNWYDKVLMMLMYYREYRTFAHVGSSYNISEAQCWRIVTTLEQWLIKSKLFHVPGRRKLTQSDRAWEVAIVDVSEHPIERPKKNRDGIIPEKRKSILTKVRL